MSPYIWSAIPRLVFSTAQSGIHSAKALIRNLSVGQVKHRSANCEQELHVSSHSMHLLFVENATSEGKKPGGQREVHDEAKDEPNNENPSSHFLHELDENDSQMEQFDTMHVTRNNNWLEYVYG